LLAPYLLIMLSAVPLPALAPAPLALSRRCVVSLSLAFVGLARPLPASSNDEQLSTLQAAAVAAFSAQDLPASEASLTELIALEPQSIAWREGRAQVLVDSKRFEAALVDYDAAIRLADGATGDLARLLTGKSLALEGLSRWQEALDTIEASLALAQQAGYTLDPYVANARGNVLSSLGRYSEAREAFLLSSSTFQSARGFKRGASTTSRLDGAIYSAINASLMAAQLGDDEVALKELSAVARRAPNSVDARAALAALQWAAGRQGKAEDVWATACGGTMAESCIRYRDEDWLGRIRRWPPRLRGLLADFLALRQPGLNS